MDMATDTGDLDVAETLFATLLDDKTIDDDISSGSDSDDMFGYLGRKKSANFSKNKHEDHEVDVLNVSEGECSSVSSDSRNVITLYAKDLARESSVDRQKSRSRQPLMSSASSCPSMVVKLARIDSKLTVPLKYQKEHSHGNEGSNLSAKTSSTSVQKQKDDDTVSPKSMSKNAVTARILRERKKKYVKDLEDSVKVLQKEKGDIETKYTQQCSHVKSLENEVQYLRNVIANQSTISALLNNIHETPGIAFTTSLKCSNKRKTLDENDNQEITANGIYVRASPRNKKAKKQRDNEIEDAPMSTLPEDPSGVCLHVANNQVSLEFCSHCASSASGAWKQQAKSEARMPLKAIKTALANKIARNRC